jgi:hypothetical protein
MAIALEGRSFRRIPIVWIGIVAAVVVVPAVLFPAALSQQRRAIAKYEEWAVDGVACPTGSPSTRAPAKTLVVEGVAFSRGSGHIACTLLKDQEGRGSADVPACQFSSPGEIRVVSSRGTFAFAPGAGKPAAVYVEDGRPRCVIGSRGRLFWPSAERPYE